VITEAPKLDPVTERTAINLLRHLEWQPQGFSLVFLFADVGPALSLANWLDQRLVGLGMLLERRSAANDFVSQPQKLVDEIIIAHPPGNDASRSALWLWLHLHSFDEQWNRARRIFLARLNERRYLLERDFGRPLILVMPSAFRSDARTIAPDLWAIRALTEELRAQQSAGVQVAEGASLPSLAPSAVGLIEPPRTDASATLRAYTDWRRTHAAAPEQAFLATARDAVGELLQVGRPADAKVVAGEALRIAQKRAEASPDSPAHLRDVSVSLDSVAGVAQAQGNWAEADGLFREGLAIRRQLLERLGGTPEALRDVSVSLDSVAGVAQAQGNWAEADSLFRESLAIRRQLLERLGGTPEALEDVAISLFKLGTLRKKRDETPLKEALQIYEGLASGYPTVVNYQTRRQIVRELLEGVLPAE
jgi:tetratricopeptide (TPR) repeat protein